MIRLLFSPPDGRLFIGSGYYDKLNTENKLEKSEQEILPPPVQIIYTHVLQQPNGSANCTACALQLDQLSRNK